MKLCFIVLFLVGCGTSASFRAVNPKKPKTAVYQCINIDDPNDVYTFTPGAILPFGEGN